MTTVFDHRILTADDEQRLVVAIKIGIEASRLLATTRRHAPTRRCELQELAAAGAAARNELVLANARLVVFQARRLGMIKPGDPDSINEVVQMGMIGLCRAADRYDPARKARFSTYAMWWIRKALTEELAKQSCRPGGGVEARESSRYVREVEEELMASTHRRPSDAEIAERTGFSAEKIRQWRIPAPTSFDQLVASAGHAASFSDIDSTADPATTAVQHATDTHLRHVVASLPDNQRRVVEARFGFDDGAPKTIEQCARILGIAVCTASKWLRDAIDMIGSQIGDDR
jgi:RNA polymerase sigma factor (sigma-70 family)